MQTLKKKLLPQSFQNSSTIWKQILAQNSHTSKAIDVNFGSENNPRVTHSGLPEFFCFALAGK